MLGGKLAFSTLIDTATLAVHTSDPTWQTVDCRFKLDDDGWGLGEYHRAHIPGAVYAHLNQDAGMYASRLWWLLRWMGHEEVAVLDGGFAKWIAETRPTTAGEERARPREFSGSPRVHMIADASEVARLVGRSDSLLLDARAPERYRGDLEPIDRVPGHIPGAVNYHFMRNIGEHGGFRSAEALRRDLQQALGQTPAGRVVCYCGSGVTACQNLLALEHAGLHGSRLYPGSWSEWSSDPSRAVERS
jgi:thiosulfate/3-mercaptopyruvate sulfurtransferase